MLFTVTLLVTAQTVAQAQLPAQPPPVSNPLGLGTDKERAACAPDVVKYCKEFLKDDAQPDVFAILGCLQTNRARISVACRQVIDNHPQ
jgi:hypothetical protein